MPTVLLLALALTPGHAMPIVQERDLSQDKTAIEREAEREERERQQEQYRSGEDPRVQRMKLHQPVKGSPAELRTGAWSLHEKLASESQTKGVKWQEIGPVEQGGRIVQIAVPTKHPGTVLVGYATGGLWQTDAAGLNWKPLFDNQSAFGIGDFDVTADGKTIWVGSGENNSQRTSYAGTGMFVSHDSGQTWSFAGLPESHHIGRVIIDPRDPKTVWVGSAGHLYSQNPERGVYKTTDDGKTWTQVLKLDDWTGIIDMAMDPRNSKVVYACAWDRDRRAWDVSESGPGSAVYKTTDGGKTWKKIEALPSGWDGGRYSIAIAPNKPDRVYVFMENQGKDPLTGEFDEFTPDGRLTMQRYMRAPWDVVKQIDEKVLRPFLSRYLPSSEKAADVLKKIKDGSMDEKTLDALFLKANEHVFDLAGAGSQVWRSDDAGKTWAKTTPRIGTHGGYYYNRVVVDPNDADTVYTTGLYLLKSTDAGKTWDAVGRNIHVDFHCVWIDPKDSKRQYNGNDGGFAISMDGGETWQADNRIPVGQFTTIAVDDKIPYNVIGGLQDNGTLRGPSTHRTGISDPSQWKEVGGGDGSMVAVDPRNGGDTIYVASQFGAFVRRDGDSGRGSFIQPRPQRGEKLRWNWLAPITVSKFHPDVIYVGSQKVHRSWNQGRAWEEVSGDLTKDLPNGNVPFSTITQLIDSKFSFERLYVGADDGSIKTTADGGQHWTDISTPAKDKWVTRLVSSTHVDGRVYCSQNGYRDDDWTAYVWTSEDFGKTWTSIAQGLPACPVNTIREDPGDPNVLYVGNDYGVYVSLNRGKSWQVLGGGLPNTPVHDVAIQARDREIVIASHARSVFKLSLKWLDEIVKGTFKDKTLEIYEARNLSGQSDWPYANYSPYAEGKPSEHPFGLTVWSTVMGEGTLELQDKDGKAVVSQKVTLDNGINFLTLSTLLKPGDRWAPYNSPEKAKDPADALKDPYAQRRPIYVPVGEYKLVLTANGQKAEKAVKVEE